jgi:voltage-gated potassium channel
LINLGQRDEPSLNGSETVYENLSRLNVLYILIVLIALGQLVRNLYKPRGVVTFRTVLLAIISYLSIVYLFATAYLALLIFDPTAISYANAESGMDITTALYFSISVIATVGFGDIHPVSAAAKAIVMFEIGAGLIYTVFIFSILAAYIRDKQ